MEGDYVLCNLCHKSVPEISKETEPKYRYHPSCRPETVEKREAEKQDRRRLDEKVARDVRSIKRIIGRARKHANKKVE